MIFFFDVDGTLLYHKQWCVPASAVDALRALHDAGHLLYLNTSRSPAEMANVLLPLADIPFDGAVLTGGALVLAHDQPVREIYAPQAEMARAMALLAQWHVPVRWQGLNDLFYTMEPPQENRNVLSWLFGFVPDVRPWQGERLMRLVVYLSDEQIAEMTSAFPALCVAPQGHTLVNITEKHVDKAEAMLTEAARLGFSPQQVVAFGDGYNDIAMLRSAGIGIAMGNCPEAVSRAAAYTTTPIEQDGILNAVRHFHFINQEG